MSGTNNDILAQNFNPYYNDFDRSKKFLQILFKPGARVQARELTQMQSILQNQIAVLAEYLLEDGNVIQGSGIDAKIVYLYRVENVQNGVIFSIRDLEFGEYQTSNGNTVNIVEKNDDEFYIYTETNNLNFGDTIETNVGELKVRDDNAQYFSRAWFFCANEGIYYISNRFVQVENKCFIPVVDGVAITGSVGFLYDQTTISAKDDSCLNDPAKGTYGFSGSGADRLLMDMQLTFIPDGTTFPSNYLELACITQDGWEYKANTPFMEGPDYTNVDLRHDNGEWILDVTGNDQNGEYVLSLCDVPTATTEEVRNFVESNSDIVILSETDEACSSRRTPLGNLVPIELDVYCSGSDPNITVGEYWLDNSGQPIVLRRRLSDGWEDIETSQLPSRIKLYCINSNEIYKVNNGVIELCVFYTPPTFGDDDSDNGVIRNPYDGIDTPGQWVWNYSVNTTDLNPSDTFSAPAGPTQNGYWEVTVIKGSGNLMTWPNGQVGWGAFVLPSETVVFNDIGIIAGDLALVGFWRQTF